MDSFDSSHRNEGKHSPKLRSILSVSPDADDAPLSPFLLLDSIGQAVVGTDPDGSIQYWNRGAANLYGWLAKEVVGRSILDVTVPEISQRQAQEIMKSLRAGEEWTGQFTVRRKDGSTFEARVTDKPVIDERGELVAVIGISEDVTAREEALQALHHSEERFKQAAETVPDIFFITDDRIRTVYINERFSEYTGRPTEYANGKGWVKVLHPDEVEDVIDHWRQCIASGEPAEFRHRMQMADGSYRWFITRSRPVHDEDGNIRHWYGTSTDIHDLIRAEEEIRALNSTLERRVEQRTEQVRALSSALTLAEQRERKRIARFLHDDLQQFLYGIKLKSDVLGKSLDAPRQDKLKDLTNAVEEAIESVRSLTIELSPPVLRGEGLSAALNWLASHLEDRYGLHVDVSACEECDLPHEDQRILLFQIIRELLFNVVKHANADCASVKIDRRGDDVCVRVSDEGVGFDVAELNDDVHRGTFGLVSVQERLALFGGSLQIDSKPGKGTTMTVLSPIEL